MDDDVDAMTIQRVLDEVKNRAKTKKLIRKG
jgi:hypothetical protein